MKKILLFALFVFLCSAYSYSQTADEIILKSLDAKGGKANVQAMKSSITEGTVSMMGMDMTFKSFVKIPKNYIQISVEGMDFKEGYDGSTAWTINPMLGSTKPKKVADDEAEQYKLRGKINEPVYNLNDEGGTAELLGDEQVNGEDTYKIKYTAQDGKISTYYFSKNSGHIVRFDKTVPVKGKDYESTTTLSDYRSTGNVMMPYKIEVDIKNSPMGKQTLTISKIDINPDIDDTIFKMPDTK